MYLRSSLTLASNLLTFLLTNFSSLKKQGGAKRYHLKPNRIFKGTTNYLLLLSGANLPYLLMCYNKFRQVNNTAVFLLATPFPIDGHDQVITDNIFIGVFRRALVFYRQNINIGVKNGEQYFFSGR